MGLKKGLYFFGFVVGLIIVGLAIVDYSLDVNQNSGVVEKGLDYTFTQESYSNVEKTPTRYEGLTENQVLKVKLIEDECRSKTMEVDMMAGETTAEIYAKKCEQNVIKMIEGYRSQNNP